MKSGSFAEVTALLAEKPFNLFLRASERGAVNSSVRLQKTISLDKKAITIKLLVDTGF